MNTSTRFSGRSPDTQSAANASPSNPGEGDDVGDVGFEDAVRHHS